MLDQWTRRRRRRSAGGGGGEPAAIGTTSETGHVVIIPLPAGFSSANRTIVDPSLVTVAATMPSLDGSGNPNSITLNRRCGFAAEVVGSDLHIWLRESVKIEDTSISLTIGTGAITNGAETCPAMFGTITNAVVARDTAPKTVFRLLRTVDTAGVYGVQHSVIDADFYIEGAGGHLSRGLAGVRFDVTQGATTVTSWALQETRSRVQDTAIIDDAQWTALGNRGLGVWSSGLITLSSFVDGEATVTATAYSLEGAITRVETWTVCLNPTGGYIARTCYVDNVAGNDSNDGLTAATAFLTLQKGVLWAGSVTGSGLTAGQIKVRRSTVKLVGGTDLSPRVYELYSGTGTGNAIPNGQDTWLTLEPAEGFSGSNTWIAAYTAGGVVPRIRRLRFRNLWIDIADAAGAGGTSSRILLGFNTSVNPVATDPVSVWFDGCEVFHHLGRAGQLTEASNASLLSTTWSKGTKAFFTRHTYRDIGGVGHRNTALCIMWDVKFLRIGLDVFKEPDCLFGWYQSESGADPQVLQVNNITGTPTTGDTISGVYSTGTATIVSLIDLGGGSIRFVLNPPAIAYTFKPDDAKQCRRVTLTGVTGTFSAGQTATFAGVSYVIGRVEGSDLYLRTTTAVAASSAVVGPTGTATTSGASVLAEGLLFTPSGARGRAGPPHPDLQQVQAFQNQSFDVSGVTGTFSSAALTIGGVAATGMVSLVGNRMTVSGVNSLDAVANGATITQASSGASAVYQGRLDWANNDRNMLLANGWADNADGVMFFAENGTGNILIYNCSAVALASSDEVGNASTTSTPGYTALHVTLPNQDFRLGNNLHPNLGAAGRRPTVHAFCVGGNFAADQIPQGAASSVDAWAPGSDVVGCVAIAASPEFSSFTGAGAVTAASPAGWVDGIPAEAPYDANANKFAPDTGSPVKSRLPAGVRPVRYDLFGNERPLDGTGAAGAAEVWLPDAVLDEWPPAVFATTRDFGGTGSSTLQGIAGGSTPAWDYLNTTAFTGGTLYDILDTVPASGGVLVYNGGVGGSNSDDALARVNGTSPTVSYRFTARMLAMDLIIQLGGAYGAGVAPEDAVRTNGAAIVTALGHNRFVFAHKHYDAVAPHGNRDHTRINRLVRLDQITYPGKVENVALMFNKFPPADGTDSAAQLLDKIPPSLQVDTAHPNTAGQEAIAERSYLPFKYALEAGNAFVPHQELFFDAPAALDTNGVVVGVIPHHPETTITGATFDTQDARFSAAVEGGAIVLRRANSTPITDGYTDIALRHTQGGVVRTVHQRVRIRDTTPTDDRTYINSQFMVREKGLSNLVNGGKKFSFAMLLRVIGGDGTARMIASTTAGLTIELKTTNRLGCVIRDTANAANPVNLDSGTGANLITAASGWRAIFFCVDTTTGVQVAKWATDANAAVTNTPTADALLSIFTPGNYQHRLFSLTDAGSRQLDIECGALWMAEDYVDFGNTANRDLFRNAGTMRSVLTGTGAIGGVTPFLWMQGPAGNWSSGLNLAAPDDFWDAGISAQMATV